MKVDCKNYRGIEYILFDELPQNQRNKFLQTLGRAAFIKIMIDGKIVSGCIQYKDYNLWFDNIYKPKTSLVRSEPIADSVELTSGLAPA